jgi:hypothetical protein
MKLISALQPTETVAELRIYAFDSDQKTVSFRYE